MAGSYIQRRDPASSLYTNVPPAPVYTGPGAAGAIPGQTVPATPEQIAASNAAEVARMQQSTSTPPTVTTSSPAPALPPSITGLQAAAQGPSGTISSTSSRMMNETPALSSMGDILSGRTVQEDFGATGSQERSLVAPNEDAWSLLGLKRAKGLY